jgi:PTS system N-acetylglucosamine-specific IIA component
MFTVGSPLPGRSLAVSALPDPVFAEGLVGPGMAILPRPGNQRAVAPVTGRLVKLYPHAYVVLTESGHGVLVHLGVDTVHMQGDGFRLHVAENTRVCAGDQIISWDPTHVEHTGRSATCAVVVLDCDPGCVHLQALDAEVEANQLLFEVDC